jgi:hypothetical protein
MLGVIIIPAIWAFIAAFRRVQGVRRFIEMIGDNPRLTATALLIPGFLTQRGQNFFLSLNFGDPQLNGAYQTGEILLTFPSEWALHHNSS